MNEGQRIEAPGAEPGRRYLTLLFADLSHSTELSELMETEHYAGFLGAVREVYQDTIPRHGGTVVRVQGDGLLALWGHPTTREDDGRNAVSAALELHQRIRELPISLPRGLPICLHSGIHSGLVLLRSGNVELGRFELLGPVPNIAARLSSAAAPHEILVSEETLGPASRFFLTGPPRLLQVKGRADPLLVYSVDARASVTESFAPARREATAFFGREAELRLLEQATEDAVAGRKRVVAVAGAPGMGKTRLIEHFLGRVQQAGWTVLRGYCEDNLGAEPMQPFRHMLQTLASETPRNTPEGFDALFARLAAQNPLLLFVDDWQWSDDASHKVAAALRERVDCPLLIVLSTRQVRAGEVAAADDTLLLPPLSEAEALRLVAARLPGIDPFVAGEICSQASGNPLFLEELCHSVARGDTRRGPGRVQGGAGWLNQLVESRVQHLPPAQVETVRVAAVIGNVIPAWLLERMTGQPVAGPLQLGLAQQDFIFPGERAGTLRFKHGLTRDIIYQSVGLAEREQLHLRIARALQAHSAAEAQDEELETLALHFNAGGDFAQAAHYAERAGDKALGASALDRARALYRVALAALEHLPQDAKVALRWVDVVQRLGRVCVFDPVPEERGLYARGLELAERHGDRATIARARHWVGYGCYAFGDAHAAIANGERALADAQAAGDAKLEVQVVAALGEAHCAAAQYEQALPLLDQAIVVMRQHHSGRHVNASLAFALVCRAYLLGDGGRFAEAHASFAGADACLVGATHEIGATINGWRGAVLLWQGRWQEARAAAEESGRHAEATRSLAQLSIARAERAFADWMLTRRPECLQTLVEVTDWLKPREGSLYSSLNHGWLAEGLFEIGRRREARHHAARALRRARQCDLLGLAMTYRALARDAAVHRPARVQHYLRLAMKAARRRGSAHEVAVTQLCAAEIAWGQHDEAQARAQLAEAVAGLRALDMAWHLQQALQVQQAMERVAATA